MSTNSDELLTDELMYFDQDSNPDVLHQQPQQQQEPPEDEEEEEEEEDAGGGGGVDVDGRVKKRKRRRSKNINVRTLFVSGLPLDTKAREIHLLFIGFKGFKGSLLKQAIKDGVECNPVAFVMFEKREQAELARNGVNGIKFDPDHPSTIKVDFAKANTKSTKAHKAKRHQNPHNANTLEECTSTGQMVQSAPVPTPPPPHTYAPMTFTHTVVMPPQSVPMATAGVYSGYELWQHHHHHQSVSTYNEVQHHTTYSDSAVHHHHHTTYDPSTHPPPPPPPPPPHHHQMVQYPQPMPHHHPLPPPHPTFTMVPVPHPQPPPPPPQATPIIIPTPIQPPVAPAGAVKCSGVVHTTVSRVEGGASGVSKEKKWTTLFVGNIPKDVDEDELEELFSRIPSFRRLRMVRNKDTSTVAFVQYKDHVSASQAKNLFHGQTVGAVDNGGIRIEFAKTPMIEGTVKLNDKK